MVMAGLRRPSHGAEGVSLKRRQVGSVQYPAPPRPAPEMRNGPVTASKFMEVP